MTQAWYRVLSQLFGYMSAVVIVLVTLLSIRKYMSDRALWRRVRKNLPQAGSVGVFSVLAGGRRLGAGEEIRVPYEGTMGSSHSCDVCIPVRKVHMRSAFFWMEKDALHMVALHRDGFLVDDVPVEPGDEAILRDGAVLRVGDAKLALRLYGSKRMRSMDDDPYVTTARRSKAQQGKGDGIGAPGRAEARREKKLLKKQAKDKAAKPEKADTQQSGQKGAKRTRR
ncbi:MAG: FHA domain-containing protein [Clostridia bacterium]|nr:FHA domain-containing protein [Clostridia bacterium]